MKGKIIKARPWKIESSEYLVKDRWLKLRADSCLRPDGTPVAPYYVTEADEWVSILALVGNRIIVIHEYHHGATVVGPGLPGGAVDAGESPVEAAQRELAEETGYVSEQWTYLEQAFHQAHLFFAAQLLAVTPPTTFRTI